MRLADQPRLFLCMTDSGYGDYIIITVSSRGMIANYKRREIAWKCYSGPGGPKMRSSGSGLSEILIS